MTSSLTETGYCRISGEQLDPLLDLGDLYLNNFVADIDYSLPKCPLQLGIGPKSGLVQLMDNPNLDLLYRLYWYRSGTNLSMKSALAEIASAALKWQSLEAGDVVLDIGCSDATLLNYFPESSIRVGIDPSRNLSAEGAEACDYHCTEFFTSDVYFTTIPAHRKAKIVTTIAMFYDLPDPKRFVQDIFDVLADNGLWVVQMSYTPLMLRQNAFDNICHEHLEYYTLSSFMELVKPLGFEVQDVELNNVNGGSFRVYLTKQGSPSKRTRFDRDIGSCRVEGLLLQEKYEKVMTAEPYLEFAKRVDGLKRDTVNCLNELKKMGKKVMGYGASTKGNTLLQYYGVDEELISAIAERQPGKWGLRTVGSWIPICSEEQMREQNPDFLFVLPWHFRSEFVEREKEFIEKGGHLVFPLPQLEIV